MKGQEQLFSSKSDEWGTPLNLFLFLDREYDFCVDVFATKDNALKWPYIGPGGKIEDALSDESWSAACERKHGYSSKRIHSFYFNPPYSKVDLAVKKAYDEWSKTNSNVYVGLLPARTDTRWFHDFVLDTVNKNKATIYFIKGRLRFTGTNSQNSAPFPSMIWVLGGYETGKCLTLLRGSYDTNVFGKGK